MITGVILHYSAQERIIFPGLLPGSSVRLSRHSLERVLFMLPIAYAAFMFGVTGGLIGGGLAAMAAEPLRVARFLQPIMKRPAT